MPREQFQSCPVSSMPKENTSGMDGMDGISMSNPPLSNHAGNAGTDWAWMGMDGIGVIPKQRLFFHWIAPSGANENQGYLLALGVDGRGRARLFEWLKCETSTVIAVTPDYLSACVFYTICEAMNAAYARDHHDCPIRTGAAAQLGARLFKHVEVFSRKNYAVRESCPKDSWDKLTHLLQNMGTRKSKASHSIEIPQARRLLKNVEVQQALKAHPAVSWCERMDSGAARIGARFVRLGFRGCPDMLGQLKDGRLRGMEVKGPTGRLRPEQSAFLECIRCAGSAAFMDRGLPDVVRKLGATK